MIYDSAKLPDGMREVVIEVNPYDTCNLRIFVMVCHDNVDEIFRMVSFGGRGT
jgi:hypothetical protein